MYIQIIFIKCSFPLVIFFEEQQTDRQWIYGDYILYGYKKLNFNEVTTIRW